MSEDQMLICLIAFVIGYLVARMMRGNGLAIAGDNKTYSLETDKILNDGTCVLNELIDVVQYRTECDKGFKPSCEKTSTDFEVSAMKGMSKDICSNKNENKCSKPCKWHNNMNEIVVNLKNVQLSGTDLSGADLSGVDLSGAQLTDVNLKNVDLSYAKLNGATLIDVDFSGAKLIGLDLSGATLDDCILPPVTGEEYETIIQTNTKFYGTSGFTFHAAPDPTEQRLRSCMQQLAQSQAQLQEIRGQN